MIITSEKTGKQYKTVEECLTDEKAFDKKIADKKAAEEKLLEERKARAKLVEEKLAFAAEARKDAEEELRAFVKDYGSFHTTLKEAQAPFSWFNTLFM